MRRWRRAAAVGLLCCAGSQVAGTAAAAHLTYYGRFGDWTVICYANGGNGAVDATGGGTEAAATLPQTCAIEARAGQEKDRYGSLVGVHDAVDGTTTVAIRTPRPTHAIAPVFLRIDTRPAHRVEPTPAGEVSWSGTEASAIIAELRTGTHAVVRSFSGAAWAPRDDGIDLEGFPAALAAYRARTRDPSGSSPARPSPNRDRAP